MACLFPRKDITIQVMSERHCELIWTNRGKNYLVIIKKDGHLSISTIDSINQYLQLTQTEFKEFVSIFLDPNDTFSTVSSSNTTHINLSNNEFIPDDSFSTLYRFLKTQDALLPSLINFYR